VTSAARKPGPLKRTPKDRTKRPTKTAASERDVARIVDLRFARVRKELRVMVAAQEARIHRELERLAADNPILRAALDAPPSPRVTEAQMAAREEFFAAVREHNDEPADEDVEAMIRSWQS
jgi:uncharacterized Zn finger protein